MDRQLSPEADRLAHESSFALARELVERATQLARKEVELARAEAKLDLARGKAAGELGAAAAVAGIGALACGLIAICDGLGHLMPVWLIALILCGAFAVTAAITAAGAWRDVKQARPRRSIREALATFRMVQHVGHS